eukprot:COSAG01_NODE_22371_length_858_cov_1.235837_2_plen_144_part_00
MHGAHEARAGAGSQGRGRLLMAANATTPVGKLVVLGPRDAYQNGGSLQERLTQMEQLVASEGLRVVVAHVDPPAAASLFAGGRLPLDLVEAGVLVPYGLPEPNETLLGLAARLPQLKLVQLMSAETRVFFNIYFLCWVCHTFI